MELNKIFGFILNLNDQWKYYGVSRHLTYITEKKSGLDETSLLLHPSLTVLYLRTPDDYNTFTPSFSEILDSL